MEGEEWRILRSRSLRRARGPLRVSACPVTDQENTVGRRHGHTHRDDHKDGSSFGSPVTFDLLITALPAPA